MGVVLTDIGKAGCFPSLMIFSMFFNNFSCDKYSLCPLIVQLEFHHVTLTSHDFVIIFMAVVWA
jgi:hypothetical protein